MREEHKGNDLLLSYLQVCSDLPFNLLTQSKRVNTGVFFYHPSTNVLKLFKTLNWNKHCLCCTKL